METPRSRQIVIAGAGVAGLTAAIAFAGKGFSVRVYEQAAQLQEVGAGIQLSPNATRILASLGVLDRLLPSATEPGAIVIRESRTLKSLASLPLRLKARERWHAPYLVVHRADLIAALTARAAAEPAIQVTTGARLRDAAFHPRGITVSLDHRGGAVETSCQLLVGADGVWSTVRGLGGGRDSSRPSGHIAWRSTVRHRSAVGKALALLMPDDAVTAFVHPRFHLVAYKVRAGAEINLVAVARGRAERGDWAAHASPAPLARLMRDAAPPLRSLAEDAAPWTVWPVHEVDPSPSWTRADGMALIGDAAHAMTPFGAQGAAMAMEDAVALASLVAARPDDLAGALAAYEMLRRPRVRRVAARGRFNHFAWHAWGPVALGRDIVLGLRSPERLMADMDWLYGHDAMRAAGKRAADGG